MLPRTRCVLWFCAGALAAGCRFEPSGAGFVPDENVDAREPGALDGGGGVRDGGGALADAGVPPPDGPPSGVPGCTDGLERQWRADFDEDPTQLDLDEDGTRDWIVRGMPGTPLSAGSIMGGLWRAQPFEELDTRPEDDFDKITTAEVRMRDLEDNPDDFGAVFWINADRSDDTFIPLFVSVRLSGSTQTLTLNTYDAAGVRQTLFEVGDLPGGLVTVGLQINGEDDTVDLWVDGQSRGRKTYEPIAQGSNMDRFATVLGYASEAELDFVQVSICSED